MFFKQLEFLTTTGIFDMKYIACLRQFTHAYTDTHTHTSFETAIVLFTCTQSQRSPSYKLTRRCREPQSSGALLTKNSRKKEKTQHKCPPGALLLLCPSFLQG